ncbi:UPF0262 family protein [Bauldia litoralis]|uniref:Uncharacterized protein, UPF0262 family n=1 Tax=Bauldia litoralis TaxID=665467 RepID=A0A1G6CWD4_9HYPH|nr:UPF0262 family protein [Bauldia litoralis]SDB37174.1 Uncharacterized protein, UPF0262 family [Bauldia litoralis]
MGEGGDGAKGRLVSVDIDPASLAGSRPFLEAERLVAMEDLIATDNRFLPVGGAGAYRLLISLANGKLVLDVSDEAGAPVVRHILSLKPLSRVVRDYFLICQTYESTVGTVSPARFEAIDMGRRGVHDEGATLLMDRLAGKIDMDFATARRLFTLVCALNWRDRHEA